MSTSSLSHTERAASPAKGAAKGKRGSARRVSPVLPKEHGTWVMLFLPYLFGVLLSAPRPVHGSLLLGWFFLYLSSAPLLNMVRNRRLWKKMLPWAAAYLAVGLASTLPVLAEHPYLWPLGALMVPLLLVNLLFIRLKKERHLLNDLSGIAIFSLGGVAAHAVGMGGYTQATWWLFLYVLLYFTGSAFYVKSMIRERKNRRFALYSHLYHLSLIPLSLFVLPQWQMLFAYLPGVLKDLLTPRRSGITPLQTGLLRFAGGLLFLLLGVEVLWFSSGS